jgi:hypothetical protein
MVDLKTTPCMHSHKPRWAFKIKPGVSGSSPRYKAWLVAKGLSQRSGIDYGETFSPLLKYEILNIILSFVTALDRKTAFLYGELDEGINLQQPEEFIFSGQETSVCRLHKSLYGHKQESRVWNATFDTFLGKFRLRSSNADLCLYIRHHEREFVSVAIWVEEGRSQQQQVSDRRNHPIPQKIF